MKHLTAVMSCPSTRMSAMTEGRDQGVKWELGLAYSGVRDFMTGTEIPKRENN